MRCFTCDDDINDQIEEYVVCWHCGNKFHLCVSCVNIKDPCPACGNINCMEVIADY
jgi:hypothetical protein